MLKTMIIALLPQGILESQVTLAETGTSVEVQVDIDERTVIDEIVNAVSSEAFLPSLRASLGESLGSVTVTFQRQPYVQVLPPDDRSFLLAPALPPAGGDDMSADGIGLSPGVLMAIIVPLLLCTFSMAALGIWLMRRKRKRKAEQYDDFHDLQASSLGPRRIPTSPGVGERSETIDGMAIDDEPEEDVEEGVVQEKQGEEEDEEDEEAEEEEKEEEEEEEEDQERQEENGKKGVVDEEDEGKRDGDGEGGAGLSGRIIEPRNRGNQHAVARARASNTPQLLTDNSSAGARIGHLTSTESI